MARVPVAFFLLATLSAVAVCTATQTFVHVSDFHYDPYYGTSQAVVARSQNCSTPGPPSSQPGCDSPLPLVVSAIADALKHDENTIMLVTGDWQRHDMALLNNSANVSAQIITTLLDAIQQYSARVVVHPSIGAEMGNDDFIPDYTFDFTHYNSQLETISHLLVGAGMLSTTEAKTFGRCGYYARDVEGTNLTLIMLNTLLWSKKLQPGALGASDPCAQFSFLNNALDNVRAQGRRAYVVSHIPPIRKYWNPLYTPVYRAIMRSYNDVIAAQFYGHTHHFSISADSIDDAAPPLFVGGSVTQYSLSNPSYSLVTVDSSSWTVLDINQRYLSPKSQSTLTWVQGQSLLQTLGTSSLSSSQLRTAIDGMFSNSAVFNSFYTMHQGGYVNSAAGPCSGLCQQQLLCSFVSFDKPTYDTCVADGVQSASAAGSSSTDAPASSSDAPASSSSGAAQ